MALAESQNWIAQSTSVPGVAQRTGATIYHVEMIPARADAPYPVLSLMPVPGDVDVVVGAELMEAGRAIQRGLVAPDKTTLIASSHRSFAVQGLIQAKLLSGRARCYGASLWISPQFSSRTFTYSARASCSTAMPATTVSTRHLPL